MGEEPSSQGDILQPTINSSDRLPTGDSLVALTSDLIRSEVRDDVDLEFADVGNAVGGELAGRRVVLHVELHAEVGEGEQVLYVAHQQSRILADVIATYGHQDGWA